MKQEHKQNRCSTHDACMTLRGRKCLACRLAITPARFVEKFCNRQTLRVFFITSGLDQANFGPKLRFVSKRTNVIRRTARHRCISLMSRRPQIDGNVWSVACTSTQCWNSLRSSDSCNDAVHLYTLSTKWCNNIG